jgi:chemotaxis protein methyltransferase CheR
VNTKALMSPLVQNDVAVGSAPRAAKPIDPVFRQIRDLVYNVSGIYQLEEKLHLLAEACLRRMKELGVSTPRDYWDRLTADSGGESELRSLLNEITIGETCLFRSQPQLDALRKVILSEFLGQEAKQMSKRLRLWSAGCSTGEEAYTLAMSMLEERESLLKGWQVEIVATDLNDRSIETAQAGIYGDHALRNTSDVFKRKYFVPAGDKKLQVRPEVKKLVTFSRLNLKDDSEISSMTGVDVIFCCNVLIYFDGPSKSRVVEHFFNNLNFGGYFFLGMSESLFRLNDEFHLVHFPGTVGYWKPSPKRGKP